MTGRLKPIGEAIKPQSTQQELNPQPKLNLLRNENQELLFLDELTQEDKFYLIQQIESKMQKNIRYDHKKVAVLDDAVIGNVTYSNNLAAISLDK